MELYCGQLPYAAGSQDVQELFEKYGTVSAVRILWNALLGRSQGVAFITMPNAEEARAAIRSLHGYQYLRRRLTVAEARVQKGPPRHDGDRDLDRFTGRYGE